MSSSCSRSTPTSRSVRGNPSDWMSSPTTEAASSPGRPSASATSDCARDGGLFAGSYACVGAVASVIPVDLHIPGCPPPPIRILRGLLALLEDEAVRK